MEIVVTAAKLAMLETITTVVIPMVTTAAIIFRLQIPQEDTLIWDMFIGENSINVEQGIMLKTVGWNAEMVITAGSAESDAIKACDQRLKINLPDVKAARW